MNTVGDARLRKASRRVEYIRDITASFFPNNVMIYLIGSPLIYYYKIYCWCMMNRDLIQAIKGGKDDFILSLLSSFPGELIREELAGGRTLLHEVLIINHIIING